MDNIERAKTINKLINSMWKLSKDYVINPPKTSEDIGKAWDYIKGTIEGFDKSDLPAAEKVFTKEMMQAVFIYLVERSHDC